MPMMKKWLLLAAFALLASAAAAQENSNDSYEFILAKMAASEGRYDEALTRIDTVIAHNPANATLKFERAMILIDAARIDAAEKELRETVAIKADFFDAQRILGRLLLDRAGQDKAKVDEALTHLLAAFRINPDDLGTGMAAAQIQLSGGRFAEAERTLASLLERAPDQRTLNYTYAQVLTKLGRGDESRKYLERSVEVDPTFSPAIQQLIDIYQRENEWERAAEVLQPLVTDDPANLDLQRQQAFFWLRAGSPEKARLAFKTLVEADPKDLRSQYYLAEALNDLERYEEADKIYRKLLEKTPDDPELLASYGLSQIGQKKYDDAAKTFRSLLALKDLGESLQALGRTQLAYIELQKGNYAAAIEQARPLLVFRDHPHPQAIGIAIEAYRKQKKYSDAVAMMQPLMDRFGSEPAVNARYIEMLARAGEKEKARAAAAAAAKYGPKNAIAAAEAYIQVEQYEPAIAILRDTLKARPDDLDVQFALGSAYERAGDKKHAEEAFLQLLDKKPEHAATLNYLGYMWAESGINLDRAADMLTRAVRQDPHNGAYIDSLGWVYFRQGKLDLAEKYLTDATRLLPHDATVHEHLADVIAKRGDFHRAIDLYREALTLDPESKDQAKIRSKIAELEKQQPNQSQR
jgi:predicted Zn-dependent protease